MDLFRSPGIDAFARPRDAAGFGPASSRRYGRYRPTRRVERDRRDDDGATRDVAAVDQEFEEYFFE